jgi:Coenzyme PQQ synthesis protein D (PqqD)
METATNTGPQQRTMAKSANLVTRDIGGETVIVPVRRGAVDINVLFVLNPTASCLWAHLDGHHTSGDLVEQLLARFETDRATAEADVMAFLDSLRQLGLAGPAHPADR